MSDQAHILLVEDAPGYRQLLRLHLERAGHRVSEAGDGAGALELLKTDTPDLLLLDLHMPGVDGWEFLERGTDDGRLAGIAVVVLTGTADEAVELQARSAGARAYLAKPIDAADVVRAVARVLREAQTS